MISSVSGEFEVPISNDNVCHAIEKCISEVCESSSEWRY